MPTLQVRWGTTANNLWCPLRNNDFSTLVGSGVYIIWGGQRTVKVGQSDDSEGIGRRLSSHSRDTTILDYEQFLGILFVTWANLLPQYLNGVERFLGDHYRPIIGDRFPNAVPISVNLPG